MKSEKIVVYPMEIKIIKKKSQKNWCEVYETRRGSKRVSKISSKPNKLGLVSFQEKKLIRLFELILENLSF
jgi:hypothetical protein